MKRRSLGLVAGLAVLAGAFAVSCSSGGGNGSGESELERGTLQLPLVTEGASGTKYRLRNATFEVINYTYYYYPYDNAGGAGGEGGSGAGRVTVSSEDDPDATSIALSVERGDYYVRLLPGWHMEKIDAGGASEVEATLLSSDTQWVYVNPHSSSWVEYEFGLGGRQLWFNGQLNIEIRVHEDPSELYGLAGQPSVVNEGGGGSGD
jgi:hypothetical protein